MNKTRIVTLLAFVGGLSLLGKFYVESRPAAEVSVTNVAVQAPNTSVPVIKNAVSVSVVSDKDVSSSNKVKRLTLDKDNSVLILGVIDETSVEIANEITAKEKAGAKELYLLLNSPGGSVMDGALIISAMEAAKIPVHTVNLQFCASMCAMIHAYGTKRYSVDRSVLMYHPASAEVQGTVPQMVSRLNFLDRYVTKMDIHIATRLGIDPELFLREINNEAWIDAEDATAKHLNDEIVSVDLKLDKPTLAIMQKVSAQMKKQFINLTR